MHFLIHSGGFFLHELTDEYESSSQRISVLSVYYTLQNLVTISCSSILMSQG